MPPQTPPIISMPQPAASPIPSPSPAPSHSSFGAVLATIVVMLLLVAGGAVAAHLSGLISLNIQSPAFAFLGVTAPANEEFVDENGNGVPDDLDAIVGGLEEMAVTGSTEVPIMVEQYGNQTNIALDASGSASSSLPSGLVRDGIYSLTGSAGDGSATYTGTVIVKFRAGTGNVYDLTWRIGGAQEQWGVGILQDNILSVGYYEQAQGLVRDAGVVSYKAGNGTLEGEWTSLQGGGTGYEQLKWLSR